MEIPAWRKVGKPYNPFRNDNRYPIERKVVLGLLFYRMLKKAGITWE